MGAMGAFDEGTNGHIDHNIALGYDTLRGADLGTASVTVSDNIAIGSEALNATGANAHTGTIAIGRSSLGALTVGANNISIGHTATSLLTTGNNNTVIGDSAFNDADAGESDNVAIGTAAMGNVDEGSGGGGDQNVCIGVSSGLGGGFGSSTKYFNENVAIGYQSMDGSGTESCIGNVFVGKSAGTGSWGTGGASYNVGIGMGALSAALTDATYNVAIGRDAGDAITEGDNNILIGRDAGGAMSTGITTIAIGPSAGSGLTTNTNGELVLLGNAAGRSITTGYNSVAIGGGAMGENASNAITGFNNTAVGYLAGYEMAGASNNNTMIGAYAGQNIESADSNGTTAVGSYALADMTDGAGNTATGYYALKECTTGDNNTAVGFQALDAMTNKSKSTAVGSQAMSACTEDDNTGIGYNVLSNLVGGQSNVHVGTSTTVSSASNNFTIFLGTGAGATPENDFQFGKSSNYVSNDFDTDANWSHSCDERKKRNINDDSLGLDFVKDLRTVTFQWKPAEEHPEEWHAWDEDEDGNKVYHEMTTDAVMHGMIAQEVKSALDTANVSTFSGWSEMENGQQQLSPEMFVYPLIKAVQELSAKVEELEEKLK